VLYLYINKLHQNKIKCIKKWNYLIKIFRAIKAEIRMGMLPLTNTDNVVMVTSCKFHIHPNYVASPILANSIALIRIPSITSTNYMKPIRVLPKSIDPMSATTLTLSGWGRTCQACE
jgi:hypothetical protein